MLNFARSFLIFIGHPMYVALGWFLKIFFKLPYKIKKANFKKLIKSKRGYPLFYLVISLVFILLGIGLYFFNKEILLGLPAVENIYLPPALSSKILDRNGKLLYTFYQNEQRTWVPLSKIPKGLVLATIAIEDKDFYQHPGFSIRGVVRAIWFNLRNNSTDEIQGGSTLTQQLVKNVFLNQEKTWKRKFREIVLALLLERKLSKDEILEKYFNQVPYGGEVYGAQEAARRYFGKDVWELSLAESTFLAGLPASPTSYSPHTSPEIAQKRQKRVIEEMVKAGFISQETAINTLESKIELRNEKVQIAAPHFVFYIKDLLEKQYGFEKLDSAGITVTTSLDWDTQQKSDQIVSSEVALVKRLRIGNGAALVVDVTNGDILAMSGSKDYYAKDMDGKVNVTTSLRQPGSSIKPINYLLAFERGATLANLIDDAPVSYKIPGQKPYSPQNYNGKFLGKVTLKTALASSLNIPSVKLLEKNGVANMINLAEVMGITSWTDRGRFGLSLALGAGEVKMTDMAQAYSNFANMGEKVKVNPILKISNYLGENVYEKKPEVTRIFPASLAFLINTTLSDDSARSPIFGLNSKLKIAGKTVAVKTGTTNSLKDNWAIGWTSKYLVAAWVGNNDSSSMSWVASGVSGATPIWNKLMHAMIDNLPDMAWEVPLGVTKARVCGKEEWFVVGTDKRVECPPPPVSGTPSPSPSP